MMPERRRRSFTHSTRAKIQVALTVWIEYRPRTFLKLTFECVAYCRLANPESLFWAPQSPDCRRNVIISIPSGCYIRRKRLDTAFIQTIYEIHSTPICHQ